MQKQTYAVIAAVSIFAASNVAVAQQSKTDKSQAVVSTSANYSKSMEQLQRAAQRLRETIQALAQQQPGPKREDAMRSAREALYDTQQAMLELPPELRNAPTFSKGGVAPDYAQSMKKLQDASNRLYSALHALARQPAGEGRNDAMRQTREALYEAEQAMLQLPNTGSTTAAAGTGSGSGPRANDKAQQPQASRSNTALAGPAVVLFPPVAVMKDNFGNGCWARLYGEQNFKGDMLTVSGPGDFAYLKTPYANIVRKWDSLMIGPKATLTAYDNENFTQAVAAFKSGQRVADLDDKLGLFENIRSLKISCGK